MKFISAIVTMLLIGSISNAAITYRCMVGDNEKMIVEVNLSQRKALFRAYGYQTDTLYMEATYDYAGEVFSAWGEQLNSPNSQLKEKLERVFVYIDRKSEFKPKHYAVLTTNGVDKQVDLFCRENVFLHHSINPDSENDRLSH